MCRYIFHWRVLGYPVFLYYGSFAWELQVGSWVLFLSHKSPDETYSHFIGRVGWMWDPWCRCGGGKGGR